MTLACTMTNASGVPCGGGMDDGICDTCGRPATPGLVTPRSGLAPRAAPAAPSRRAPSGPNTGVAARLRSPSFGLVALPPVPTSDPMTRVMADPAASLGCRRCPHCGSGVSRIQGFCPDCSQPYDFTPRLAPGETVVGTYEVIGPIALGGMGWIHLARDVGLDRLVVLKGLLNAHDPDGEAAAEAERRALSAARHPGIVSIHGTARHGDDAYMVLEFVDGPTLDDVRRESGPFPPELAIAYTLSIMPAVAHLHALGLVHCDLKPSNVMVHAGGTKLVDLGTVRVAGDPEGALFGTDGFSAPEAADLPTTSSDVYSLGRILAVLAMDFLYRQVSASPAPGAVPPARRMRLEHVSALPTAADQPLLADNDAFRLLLDRACHPDPAKRFASVEEMEDQLLGVLRQTLGAKGRPCPAPMGPFGPDGLDSPADLAGMGAPLARILPSPTPDPGDRATAELSPLLLIRDLATRLKAVHAVHTRRPGSNEAQVRLAECLALNGQASAAVSVLQALLRDEPAEWRADWMLGIANLSLSEATTSLSKSRHHVTAARAAFESVRARLPGETAPILAVASCLEAAWSHAAAARLYASVAATDPSLTSARFGLARCKVALKDAAAAREALSGIPPRHATHGPAMAASARMAVAAVEDEVAARKGGRSASLVSPALLDEATAALSAVPACTPGHAETTGRLLMAAAELVALVEGGNSPLPGTMTIGGTPIPLESKALRAAGEGSYRDAARLAPDTATRARLLDLAATARPRRWFKF